MKTLLIIVLLWVPSVVFSQQKTPAYLFFDAQSEDTCSMYKSGGQELPIMVYEKILSSHKPLKIRFYVCEQKFIYDSKIHKRDTVNVSCMDEVSFTGIEEMLKVVNQREKKIPFSYLNPGSAFSEIALFEKINEKQFVRYEVIWEYYIE